MAVVSPYAKLGAVVHTRYDLLSVVRSVELLAGLEPLALGDALAVPMYDALSPTVVNAAPIGAITPSVDLLERNTASSPDAEWSIALPLDGPDQVSQATLDRIIWHSVHGPSAQPPPVGPGASREDEELDEEEATAAAGARDTD